MIMSASSLPIKEVIQHIDSNWIEPLIECLIDWNLKYLEPKRSRRSTATKPRKPGRRSSSSASRRSWTGRRPAPSFMQKEVLANKIRAFSEFAMSNPATAPLIDARELLQQTWDVMEIGRESPIMKEEGEQKMPPQVQQKMQETSSTRRCWKNR
jgi:hypothetical protein